MIKGFWFGFLAVLQAKISLGHSAAGGEWITSILQRCPYQDLHLIDLELITMEEMKHITPRLIEAAVTSQIDRIEAVGPEHLGVEARQALVLRREKEAKALEILNQRDIY